ncbi:hypothetical protein C942_00510 [Photobacterium marinum]|uniref:Uncharacterized protein n=2 Tax=Photobacterium marinum TaxID=1056511 RepID=L8JCP9_9GAMM|nr:hypothetical protein C942_00510 [Photobacterium marinum]
MDKTVYVESDTGTINREHHTNIVNDVSKADYKIYINKYTCQPDILYEIETDCDYEPERFIPLKYHLTEYQALGKNEYQQQLKETDFKILKELEKMFLQDHPLVTQRNELRNGFNKTVGKLKEEGAINDSNGRVDD